MAVGRPDSSGKGKQEEQEGEEEKDEEGWEEQKEKRNTHFYTQCPKNSKKKQTKHIFDWIGKVLKT